MQSTCLNVRPDPTFLGRLATTLCSHVTITDEPPTAGIGADGEHIWMKYKLIRSMAHNWSHSFMSEMNYVDGAFVYEDVYKLARERRGEKVIINWIPADSEVSRDLPSRVQKCAEAYWAGLSEHLRRHHVDASALKIFRTEVYVAENFRMYVRAFVIDDRDKEHVAFVWR
jgi:hypothetical protein